MTDSLRSWIRSGLTDLVTIYHGDAREVLPTLQRADLLLTDPPYGIGKDGQTPTTDCEIAAARCSQEVLGLTA